MNYYQDPRVGLYIRLSRDDLRTGESMSVENQRIFLNNYAKEQGWSNVTEYVDDGYTGVNFDRPSFKRMMEDVKKQKINIIVCKDMSRFGRNYIQVGEFTDYILPSAGCALIALNDGVDTRKAMWDNNYFPCESSMCNTPQMREVQQYIERHKEELEKTLTAEQKVIYEKLIDNISELDSIIEKAIFVCGFKYGARVTAEALLTEPPTDKA